VSTALLASVVLESARAQGDAAQAVAKDAPVSADAPASPAQPAATTEPPAALDSAAAQPAALDSAAAQPAALDSAAAQPAALASTKTTLAPPLVLSPSVERAQLASLRGRLLAVERERDDVNLVLPWSVFAIGAAALVVGSVLGIERAIACDASCSGPFWPSWLVVGGATVGSLGLVWLRLEHEELSALRSRHYHLKNQLEAYELNRAALAPTLRVHGSF
jgi:hypothetical protein